MKIKKSKELRSAFAGWVDKTALHGITYIYYSSSFFVQLIWTVVFCVLFSFGWWLLYRSFSTYFSRQTDTSVTRVRVSEMTFPSVTICNLYYSTDINEKNYSAEVKKTMFEINSASFMTNLIRKTFTASLFGFIYTGERFYKSFLEQDKIGFDFWNEMLMGCFYMNSNCIYNPSGYKEVISPYYGKCYTSPGSGQTCKIKKI